MSACNNRKKKTHTERGMGIIEKMCRNRQWSNTCYILAITNTDFINSLWKLFKQYKKAKSHHTQANQRMAQRTNTPYG